MAGYLSIKAYGLQDQTTFQFNELQDLHGGAWLLFCATSRWLAIRLDSIIAIYITIVAGTADFFQVEYEWLIFWTLILLEVAYLAQFWISEIKKKPPLLCIQDSYSKISDFRFITDINRYRRGLETFRQAKTSKSGHAIFFSFFRRVRTTSMAQRRVENTRVHFRTFSFVSVKSLKNRIKMKPKIFDIYSMLVYNRS